jgi:hypothetical protein
LFPFVCFLVPGRLTTKEDVYPSDFRGSHLTQRESKLFEKKEKTIPSPLQQFRGRQFDPVDPVAPVDIPRDIAVGHKRPV